MTRSSDIIVVGGGIVGLAAAYHLARTHPEKSLVLLEKEPDIAVHQTGHNSGVLHSGVYYRPGSLKAQNCRAGLELMAAFCRCEGIPHEICGKVIVAVEQAELPALQQLYERGQANGVRCELIGPERLREIEPHCAGLRALHLPEAGIVDFARVCRRLAGIVREAGHRIVTRAPVLAVRENGDEVVAETDAGEFRAGHLVNCAGLHSDRVTALTGARPSVKIFPFRGEYYELTEGARHLCRHLIYPVPDPAFPFLGVHLTRMVSGGIHCGPNAVLALAREGYRKTDVRPGDLAEMLGYSGFYRMVARHWRMGLEELWRSLSKDAFVRALQRLVPEIRREHLISSPAGVRAQAVAPDGSLLDDFAFAETRRILNVVNAPSPAATSSLSIGRLIATKVAERL